MPVQFRSSYNKLWRVAASFCRRSLSPLSLAGITLVWQPNTESDLAGYKVYIGERSQQYTQVLDVGKNTAYALDHLPRDKDHYMVVTAYDLSGNESAHSQEVVLTAADGASPGAENTLAQVYNFPNPFNPNREATTIRYYLAQPTTVTVRVFDLKGDPFKSIVENAPRPAGENLGEVWDGTDERGMKASPGLYYIEIRAQGQKAVIRAAVVP